LGPRERRFEREGVETEGEREKVEQALFQLLFFALFNVGLAS